MLYLLIDDGCADLMMHINISQDKVIVMSKSNPPPLI